MSDFAGEPVADPVGHAIEDRQQFVVGGTVLAHAAEHYAGTYDRIDVRFRGARVSDALRTRQSLRSASAVAISGFDVVRGRSS